MAIRGLGRRDALSKLALLKAAGKKTDARHPKPRCRSVNTNLCGFRRADILDRPKIVLTFRNMGLSRPADVIDAECVVSLGQGGVGAKALGS